MDRLSLHVIFLAEVDRIVEPVVKDFGCLKALSRGQGLQLVYARLVGIASQFGDGYDPIIFHNPVDLLQVGLLVRNFTNDGNHEYPVEHLARKIEAITIGQEIVDIGDPPFVEPPFGVIQHLLLDVE